MSAASKSAATTISIGRFQTPPASFLASIASGRDGAYWLHDVSTNGTFLNNNARRIQTPYRLRHGDRLTIGPFVIGVAIVEDENPLPGRGDERRLLDSCELAPAGPSLRGIAPEANREALSKDPVGGGPNGILCKPVDAGDREVQALEFQTGSLPDRSAPASIKETPIEPEAGRPASLQQATDGNGPSLEEFLRRFTAAAKIPVLRATGPVNCRR